MIFLSKHTFIVLSIVTMMISITNNSFGQIDTVMVDVQFSTITNPESSDSTLNVMRVNIEVTDIDFLGNVVVTVYNPTDHFPLARVKRSKSELDAANEISGNAFSIDISGIVPGNDYRIETLVRNFQGANYPVISTNYNGQ